MLMISLFIKWNLTYPSISTLDLWAERSFERDSEVSLFGRFMDPIPVHRIFHSHLFSPRTFSETIRPPNCKYPTLSTRDSRGSTSNPYFTIKLPHQSSQGVVLLIKGGVLVVVVVLLSRISNRKIKPKWATIWCRYCYIIDIYTLYP
jgi:hypothetical protein